MGHSRGRAGVQKDTCAPKNGAKSGLYSKNLTDSERDVLHLLANEKLTIKQAASRRDVKPRAIYKMRQRLIEKGVLNIVNDVVHNQGGHSSVHSVHQIRLHAEQYDIKIIQPMEAYLKRLKSGNCRLMIDGNTIMLYRNKVEVYSNTSFYGKDAADADKKAMRYWTRFIVRLEQSIKCILMKVESQNINRVRAEYAETGNELATKFIREHEKIRVCDEKGGAWLVVDNSFNFAELETVNPRSSKQDMQDVVQPFFNDLRDHQDKIILPFAVSQTIKRMSDEIANLASATNAMAQGIQANSDSIQAILNVLKTQMPKQHDITEMKTERPDYCG